MSPPSPASTFSQFNPHQIIKTPSPRLRSASLLVLFASAVLSLHAADYTWTGDAGSGASNRSWELADNRGGALPSFSGTHNYIFGGATNTGLASPSCLRSTKTVGTIVFSDTADANIGIRLTGSATNTTGRNLIV
jgi:hypothetical protein